MELTGGEDRHLVFSRSLVGIGGHGGEICEHDLTSVHTPHQRVTYS